MLFAVCGYRRLNLRHPVCFRNTGKPRLDPLAQGVESPLHATNAFKKAGVDQGSNRLPILVDHHTIVTILDEVEHLAQVLTEGDGTCLGNHGRLQ